MSHCAHCGQTIHKEKDRYVHPIDGAFLHNTCAELYIPEGGKHTESTSRAPLTAQQESRLNTVILTTVPTVANQDIDHEIGIITAECAFGMNIFRDMFAGIRDIVGGRSDSMQKVLRDARESCLRELKREAMNLRAHAVIGVDLDYSEFSGGGKSMLFLVASGTAVKLKDPT